MEYEVQFKPFVEKEGVKYRIIEITDITWHSTHKRPTESIFAKFLRAFRANKPGRIYASVKQDPNAFNDSKAYILDILKNDPNLAAKIREEEEKGYKILIHIPREGVKMIAGDDTVEFIESKNGKRVLRGLAKKNDSDKISE